MDKIEKTKTINKHTRRKSGLKLPDRAKPVAQSLVYKPQIRKGKNYFKYIIKYIVMLLCLKYGYNLEMNKCYIKNLS